MESAYLTHVSTQVCALDLWSGQRVPGRARAGPWPWSQVIAADIKWRVLLWWLHISFLPELHLVVPTCYRCQVLLPFLSRAFVLTLKCKMLRDFLNIHICGTQKCEVGDAPWSDIWPMQDNYYEVNPVPFTPCMTCLEKQRLLKASLMIFCGL